MVTRGQWLSTLQLQMLFEELLELYEPVSIPALPPGGLVPDSSTSIAEWYWLVGDDE
jgi:hypothetical protein